MDYQVLTAQQAEQFVERGYVAIRGCFTREAAQEYTAAIWTRLGYAPDDPGTWTQPSVHMPGHRDIDIRKFAPKAWGAVCDLVGGAQRIQPYRWNDGFIVNLSEGADRPWQPASPAAPGWHKDGDFFRHFLDSPEQGLLTLVLWSEVRHQGGATFVAADSVGPVARFLAEHPEGVYPPSIAWTGAEPQPATFAWGDLVGQCGDFVEATGEVGDVYLLHPYILHAKAQNVLRVPRYITNPPVHLVEPMRFDRADPADLSLVERAVLRGLGVDHYPFTARGPREELVPERVAMHRSMKQAEQQRLSAAGMA
ncbi:hypothetical protein Rhe02_05610 [Rhizocola hellebori]|uniref:Phytanoyl-CoA dioxygenase n=1 Tax=Rhizocola hellebori TaxID=1392758 RepID=A0A8J3Q2X3_9ACTN|nr:hypothetical protein [Rhizocola hellebori]GIH02494.1 hypothetical protein Rhe02_05610 [Rhizocola hellebori]